MIVYPARDIHPFVMYCVNGKPRSSLLIGSTDSMIKGSMMKPLIMSVLDVSTCILPVYLTCETEKVNEKTL